MRLSESLLWIVGLAGAFLLAQDVRGTPSAPVLFLLCFVGVWFWRQVPSRFSSRGPLQRRLGAALPRPALVAALLAAGVLALGLLVLSPRPGSDTGRYGHLGRFLLDRAWDDPREVLDGLTLMYLLPNLLFAASERAVGEAYQQLIVLLNIGAFSTVVWCCFRVWQLVSPSLTVGQVVIGLLLLLGCYDVVIWNYYVLTDILFLALVAVFWLALVRWIVEERATALRLALLVAIVSLVVRPAGVLLFVFAVAAVGYVRVARAQPARRAAIAVMGAGAAIAFAMIVWPALLYLDQANVALASAVVPDELVSWYQAGAVVCDRPETYRPSPVAYVDYVTITVLKWFHFFFPFRGGYSFAHNALLALYFPLLWALFPRGVVALRRRGDSYALLSTLLMLFVLAVSLFHSMLYVDYDWRYQLPAMWGMWVLAGCAHSPRIGEHHRSPPPGTVHSS